MTSSNGEDRPDSGGWQPPAWQPREWEAAGSAASADPVAGTDSPAPRRAAPDESAGESTGEDSPWAAPGEDRSDDLSGFAAETSESGRGADDYAPYHEVSGGFETVPEAPPPAATPTPSAVEPPVTDPYGSTPYGQPSATPYSQPSTDPYAQPSATPYGQPSATPYSQPSASPYGQPSATPYAQPAAGPYGQPAPQPQPQPQPQSFPSYQPPTGPASNPYGANPYAAPTQGYGMATYGNPTFAVTHPRAVPALVLGILGMVCCVPAGVVGIVLGASANRDITAEPQRYTGKGMAMAGLILGIIGTIIGGITWIVNIIGAISGS